VQRLETLSSIVDKSQAGLSDSLNSLRSNECQLADELDISLPREYPEKIDFEAMKIRPRSAAAQGGKSAPGNGGKKALNTPPRSDEKMKTAQGNARTDQGQTGRPSATSGVTVAPSNRRSLFGRDTGVSYGGNEALGRIFNGNVNKVPDNSRRAMQTVPDDINNNGPLQRGSRLPQGLNRDVRNFGYPPDNSINRANGAAARERVNERNAHDSSSSASRTDSDHSKDRDDKKDDKRDKHK
jgi:hypothetical protein